MPPAMVVRLRARRTNVLRAQFDVPPRALDPAAFHDALNPRNWSLARTTGGYAPPVVRVEPVEADARSVDVFLLSDLDADIDYDALASSAIEAAT